MNIDTIKRLVSNDHYAYSMHADIERKEDGLSFEEIEMAILSGEILEQYPDSGRGKSCLVVGFAHNVPIHVVCGLRGEKLSIITVYIPKPPKFVTPWKRGMSK